MTRYQPTVFSSCLIGLALLGSTPSQVVAQAPRGGPRLAVVVAPHASSAPSQTLATGNWRPSYQSRGDRSAVSIIATHAAVGTAAGLVIGLVLSSASVDKDQSSVVLTWTALGAAGGIVSGVVACLVGRQQ